MRSEASLKISPTMGIKRFSDICSNAGSRANELIRQNRFSFFPLYFIAYLDNLQRKSLRFLLQRAAHINLPLRILLLHYSLLPITSQKSATKL